MIIANHILKACKAGGDAVAISFGDEVLTWHALSDGIEQLRALLREANVPAEVSVGLLGRNRLAPVSAFVAALGAGRSVVLINVARSDRMVAEEVEELKLACVLGEENDFTSEMIRAAQSDNRMLVVPKIVEGRLRFEALTKSSQGDFRQAGQDILFEIQTSGTTGKPKRIPVKESTLAASLKDGVRTATGTVQQDKLAIKSSPTLMFSPLVHTSGAFNTLMSIFEVRPIVLLEKFDPEKFRAAIVKYKVKFAPLPPPAMKMLLDSSATAEDFASVIAVRAGTAPLSVELQTEFEEKFGVPVLTNYGATEFMGVATSWTLGDYEKYGKAKRGSVGRASKGVELRIVDPATGEPLAAGQQGVLEVKFDRLDGGKNWLRTTDLARIDADGFLFIHGRSDDAIIRGGFKVMAGKIADAVKQHPSVHDAIVLGWPDERLGQVPIAVIELYADATPVAAETLKAFLKDRLTAYEVPARFYFADKLPRTVSEKISRPATIELVKQMEAAPA